MIVFDEVEKKDVVRIVMSVVGEAKKEVFATMLLSEEILNPLPKAYHELLQVKLSEGVHIKRLGFGTEDEYRKVQSLYPMQEKEYTFRFSPNVIQYQRLILIDGKVLFTKIGNTFFICTEKSIIEGFEHYFLKLFQKGEE